MARRPAIPVDTRNGVGDVAFTLSGQPDTLTLVDNGDGSAEIVGTIAAGEAATSPYTTTITATDDADETDSQSFTITVVTAVALDAIDDQEFTEETEITPVEVSVTSGTGDSPYVLSVSGLPSGLTFTDDGDGTGSISGTPATGTSAGSPYTVTVTVTDAVGQQASQEFTATVASPSVGTWTQLTAPATALDSGPSMSYDAARGVMWVTHDNSPLRIAKYDIGTDTWTTALATRAGTNAGPSQVGGDIVRRFDNNAMRPYDIVADSWGTGFSPGGSPSSIETMATDGSWIYYLTSTGTFKRFDTGFTVLETLASSPVEMTGIEYDSVSGDVIAFDKSSSATVPYRYDPSSDTWTSALTAGGVEHLECGMAALGGKVYLMGGTASASDKFSAYDVASDSWETLDAPPSPWTGGFQNRTAGESDGTSLFFYVTDDNQLWRYDP